LLDDSENKNISEVAKKIGRLIPYGLDGYIKQLDA